MESEKQMDKLRRKEERRHKRGAELGVDTDASFSSLIEASERKNPIENLMGSGPGSNSLLVTALPQGTTRKHLKGYEEVIIPPTPTAQMKPGERLVSLLTQFPIVVAHRVNSDFFCLLKPVVTSW